MKPGGRLPLFVEPLATRGWGAFDAATQAWLEHEAAVAREAAAAGVPAWRIKSRDRYNAKRKAARMTAHMRPIEAPISTQASEHAR